MLDFVWQILTSNFEWDLTDCFLIYSFFILGQSSVASFYLPQDIGGIAYFELPFSIMGNNIKSYGGYLTYILNYRGRGQGPNNSPDIIIIVSLKKDTGIPRFPGF